MLNKIHQNERVNFNFRLLFDQMIGIYPKIIVAIPQMQIICTLKKLQQLYSLLLRTKEYDNPTKDMSGTRHSPITHFQPFLPIIHSKSFPPTRQEFFKN